MEPNALRHIKNANVQMMTAIVPSESTFSQLEILNLAAITTDRMPNPYAGEDHVKIMKWFLEKVL